MKNYFLIGKLKIKYFKKFKLKIYKIIFKKIFEKSQINQKLN